MNTSKLICVASFIAVLGGCATHPKDTAQLDGKINAVTDEDFGQFLLHQNLAEENLEEARTIRQWWGDDHYWNIDTRDAANAAADRALKHRQMAEKALEGWHDRCVRHPNACELIAVAYFDTGSAVPKTVKQEVINHIIAMSATQHVDVEVIGYTDTVGKSDANKHLATHRANAMHDLLHKQGISSHAVIKNIPVGEARGPDNLDNPANRRVDVKVHVQPPYPK